MAQAHLPPYERAPIVQHRRSRLRLLASPGDAPTRSGQA